MTELPDVVRIEPSSAYNLKESRVMTKKIIATLIPTWLQEFEKENMQEEIREGIVKQLIEQSENNLLYNLSLLRKGGEEREYLGKVAGLILSYLHSQGVVIKVEYWLPTRSGMTCTIEPLVGEPLKRDMENILDLV